MICYTHVFLDFESTIATIGEVYVQVISGILNLVMPLNATKYEALVCASTAYSPSRFFQLKCRGLSYNFVPGSVLELALSELG